MRVSLLSFTNAPVRAIFVASRICYSGLSIEKLILEYEQKKDYVIKLLSNLYKKGHHSVFEHASFSFIVEDISRTASHQIVRHRIASYSQQSQRYSRFDPKAYVIPESLNNIPEIESFLKDASDLYIKLTKEYKVPQEDARFILPQAVKTRLVVTMNLRELLHFWKLRLHPAAQWEIRKAAAFMLQRVLDFDEELNKLLNGIEPELIERLNEILI